MQNATTRTVFDVITNFLTEDLQACAGDLAARNGEGQLTQAGREELQTFVNADEIFSLLKTKMKLKHQAEETEGQTTAR